MDCLCDHVFRMGAGRKILTQSRDVDCNHVACLCPCRMGMQAHLHNRAHTHACFENRAIDYTYFIFLSYLYIETGLTFTIWLSIIFIMFGFSVLGAQCRTVPLCFTISIGVNSTLTLKRHWDARMWELRFKIFSESFSRLGKIIFGFNFLEWKIN